MNLFDDGKDFEIDIYDIICFFLTFALLCAINEKGLCSSLPQFYFY